MIITPAILATTKEEFEHKLKIAVTLSKRFQIDFMDGQFVPTKSLPVAEMPTFTNKEVVAHLMVNEPQTYLRLLKEKQFQEVIFHLEAKGVTIELVHSAVALNFKVALALNPPTSVQELDKFALELKEDKVTEILLLAVEPGYSGQKFQPEVLNKVDFIKQHYKVKISIDGGVNRQNLSFIVKKAVDEVYVGSGLFRQENPSEAYKKLQQLASLT